MDIKIQSENTVRRLNSLENMRVRYTTLECKKSNEVGDHAQPLPFEYVLPQKSLEQTLHSKWNLKRNDTDATHTTIQSEDRMKSLTLLENTRHPNTMEEYCEKDNRSGHTMPQVYNENANMYFLYMRPEESSEIFLRPRRNSRKKYTNANGPI